MGVFVKTYETELDDHIFALRFARVILEKYNGQRGGRKLPYRFRG